MLTTIVYDLKNKPQQVYDLNMGGLVPPKGT
jgi:hypothetical protein